MINHWGFHISQKNTEVGGFRFFQTDGERDLNLNCVRERKIPHPVDGGLAKNYSKAQGKDLMQERLEEEKRRVERGLPVGPLLLSVVSHRFATTFCR